MDQATKVRPSEQFANLRQAAEAMDDCQDKTDLLALFELADELWYTVDSFGIVARLLKRQGDALMQDVKWFRKWRPLLEHMELIRHEEKVVPLQRARESDANV
jgi:hypothetical protein